MESVKEYLKKIETAYGAGNATEHTHRPALKDFIESIIPGITATNEPRRENCGAPDYIVTKGHTPLGYIEAKDVGKSLAEVEKTDQLKRYLESLGNLILTDYLEFRWYVGGKHRMTARLASIAGGKVKPDKDGAVEALELLRAFLSASVQTVSSPRELAVRMAALAKLIRDIIRKAFEQEDLTDDIPDPLHDQLKGFQLVLIHDLTPEQFADMYAQTICYGLFAARCNTPAGERFTRQGASFALPKTNPFLKRMFGYIAGTELDERIVWAVDDLAELLHHTDIEAILRDFGRRTRREDPVVHFYETFLAAYDPKMREARGVYYTPEPVVSYIVRSIDHILRTDFGLPEGMADTSKVTLTQPGMDKKQVEVHKVQILDPATGTGTFLHGVIDQIYEGFKADKGMWSGYVSRHLLPRMHGFELLMAPYAVAHMKLGIQLAETGYDFKSSERIKVYLTNTLEEAHSSRGSLFTQWIAEEANAANGIKKNTPVMVILGNPPYSGHSANKGTWITKLLKGEDIIYGSFGGSYFKVDGMPLGEKNPKWLNDDYVKFIRFAQWRIERTGYGVLAFISNNGYLDNPTFRGMRQSLMQTFDDIYILDLHGSSKKKERCPDGSEDKNVFDIQQGVAIGIFVKRTKGKEGLANVHHADLWGKREVFEEKNLVGGKYYWLWENDVASTKWKKLKPQSPKYLFIPQDEGLLVEYEGGFIITEMLPINSVGIVTARDELCIHFSPEQVWNTVNNFSGLSEEEAREKYNLGPDARDWKVLMAQKDLKNSGPKKENLTPILYRPFDVRHTYYTGNSRGFHCMPRGEVMGHMLPVNNLGLITTGQTKDKWDVLITRYIIGHKALATYDINKLFPLYLCPVFESGKRTPNLSSKFISDFSARLKMSFIPDGKGDRKKTFGPEDVFSYMYAVFHSPTYRTRYAEFLKTDFPRLPLTSRPELFRKLCFLGDELVSLHLMSEHGPKLASYPVAGDSTVVKVRYEEPHGDTKGRVWINGTQYFEGVPKEVWEFHVGGYQVCEKWLKDRKGRPLTFEDLTHYQYVVSALSETIRLMAEIDKTISESGGWPIA